MAASDSESTFDAGSVERVLDEFRATHDAVELLFRVHIDEAAASELSRETVEAALTTLSASVCLALDRGNQHTEYLHHVPGEGWYSLTQTSTRTTGPIPVYDHNVTERLDEYELAAAKVTQTPLANRELPGHDLDVDADGVMLDV